VNKSLDLTVMRNLVVGGDAQISKLKAKVLEVKPTIASINGFVLTLDSIAELASGATGTGLSSTATFTVDSVNSIDTQITIKDVVGTLVVSEILTIDTPYISQDPDAVITVGGAKTDPSLLGDIGQDFGSGLAGKVPWEFYGYDGAVVYGAAVSVPTRNTVIIYTDGSGDKIYYTLTSAPPIPYSIDGTIATDLVNFDLLSGIAGSQGARGIQGPIGAGTAYTWRKVDDTSIGGDLAVVSGDGIDIDTRVAVVSIVLPASPLPQDRFSVRDYLGSWDTNKVTLVRSGENIMGLAEDMTLETKWSVREFYYVDATVGWRIM